MEACLKGWIKKNTMRKLVVVFLCWGIRKSNNLLTFKDRHTNLTTICMRIIGYYKEYKAKDMSSLKKQVKNGINHLTYHRGFFDGAAQDGIGGCGFLLFFNEYHSFHCWLAIGSGTNIHAKLVALCALMLFAYKKDVHDLTIYGDSRVVIDSMNGLKQT